MARTTDTTTKNTFSGRIKQIRGGLSVKDFAARTGVNEKTLHNIDHAKAVPGGLVLVKICLATGTNGNWLLTGKGPQNSEDLPGESTSHTLQEIIRLLKLFEVKLDALHLPPGEIPPKPGSGSDQTLTTGENADGNVPQPGRTQVV